MQALGLNMIRLHQKTNPQRYYYHADRLGMVIQQDMVQHCKRPIIDLVSESRILAQTSPHPKMFVRRGSCRGVGGHVGLKQRHRPCQALLRRPEADD